jgi:hypothetical protein
MSHDRCAGSEVADLRRTALARSDDHSTANHGFWERRGSRAPPLSSRIIFRQIPFDCCGNATCTASSTWMWFPSMTAAPRGARATDPRAFETVAAHGAACRDDADCAMTGDAKAAIATVARIAFRLVAFVDMVNSLQCYQTTPVLVGASPPSSKRRQ